MPINRAEPIALLLGMVSGRKNKLNGTSIIVAEIWLPEAKANGFIALKYFLV